MNDDFTLPYLSDFFFCDDAFITYDEMRRYLNLKTITNLNYRKDIVKQLESRGAIHCKASIAHRPVVGVLKGVGFKNSNHHDQSWIGKGVEFYGKQEKN